MPVMRRTVVAKWLAVLNPTARAIELMEDVDAVSRAVAASIRRRTTKRCGDIPVARLKSRAK
jgi:hypothetical protein